MHVSSLSHNKKSTGGGKEVRCTCPLSQTTRRAQEEVRRYDARVLSLTQQEEHRRR
jgi:hypothetical protein